MHVCVHSIHHENINFIYPPHPLQVQKKIENYNKLGYNKFAICMAKTANSVTGDQSIKGAPTGFTLNITNIFVSVGARFVVPMVGEVSAMILFQLLN